MTIFKVYSEVNTRPGEYRVEYIDTKKNVIFKNVKTQLQMKHAYESYWGIGSEKVKATKVEIVNIKSKGENWGIKFHKIPKQHQGKFSLF